MIFDCPNCGAVNGVPEANLAPSGTLLKCRACLQVFRVFPPDDDEVDESSVDRDGASLPDSTNIEPIPSALRHSEPQSPLEKEDQQTIELSNGAIIENILSQPVYEGISDGDTEDSFSATDEFVAAGASQLEGSISSEFVVRPASQSAEYEAFVESRSHLSDPSEISVSAPRYEHLRSIRPGANENKSLSRKAAELWRRSPLSLKAAVAVFPVAFVVGLMLGGPESDGSLNVQNASARSKDQPKDGGNIIPLGSTLRDERAAPTRSSTSSTKSRDPETTVMDSKAATAKKSGHPRDHMAPKNHAFVLPRKLFVRAKPKTKAQITGRFSQGDLVRVYDDIEQWSLVYMPGGGAVGFVPTNALGSQKTLPTLIAESRYEGCLKRVHGRLGRCLEHAQAKEAQCMDSCGAVDDASASSLRCRKICTGAYEVCAKSCRSRRMSKRKRGRRRTR